MRQTIFFLLVAFFCLQCSGQDKNAELTKLWNETKSHFSRKGEEGKKLATIAMDSKVAKPDIVAKVLASANAVVAFSRDDVKLDSVKFYTLSRFNDSLDASIGVLLTQLDNDKQFALLNTYATFKLLYDASAKRVYAEKNKFNDLASKFKSPYYFRPPDATIPNVKF